MNSRVQKAGLRRARGRSNEKQSEGQPVTDTLATDTLMRGALRVSPARVRVLGRSNSRFNAERGSEPSVPVERSQ